MVSWLQMFGLLKILWWFVLSCLHTFPDGCTPRIQSYVVDFATMPKLERCSIQSKSSCCATIPQRFDGSIKQLCVLFSKPQIDQEIQLWKRFWSTEKTKVDAITSMLEHLLEKEIGQMFLKITRILTILLTKASTSATVGREQIHHCVI